MKRPICTFSPVFEEIAWRSCSIVCPSCLSLLTCSWLRRTTSSNHLRRRPSAIFRAEEEAARREREEQERREAEERALREAEEQERRAAEERARREAEEAGFAPDEAATPSGTRAEGAAGPAAPRERRTFDPDDES